MSMVIAMGLFSILLAGLASFVSFMGRQQKHIEKQVTEIALRQELTNYLTAKPSWQNSRAGNINQSSFACLTDRKLKCSGVPTSDQKYYRFSLFDTATKQSQPLFPNSPIGLGGFTSDGRVCAHGPKESPQTGSDSCPYFVEIGWRFQCDYPCLSDTIEIRAELKYRPRTQSQSTPSAKSLAVYATVREPQLLNSQLSTYKGKGIVKYKPSGFTNGNGCNFTVEDIMVPIFIAEPSILLAQGYGRSHMIGGPHGVELTAQNKSMVHNTKLEVFVDPTCNSCPNKKALPGPQDEPAQSGKGHSAERTGEDLGHCPDASCRSDLHVDNSGIFELAPGQHNILLRHRAWHCLGVPVTSNEYWAEIDMTTFNISFIK